MDAKNVIDSEIILTFIHNAIISQIYQSSRSDYKHLYTKTSYLWLLLYRSAWQKDFNEHNDIYDIKFDDIEIKNDVYIGSITAVGK